jgi:hypothetical protein
MAYHQYLNIPVKSSEIGHKARISSCYTPATLTLISRSSSIWMFSYVFGAREVAIIVANELEDGFQVEGVERLC